MRCNRQRQGELEIVKMRRSLLYLIMILVSMTEYGQAKPTETPAPADSGMLNVNGNTITVGVGSDVDPKGTIGSRPDPNGTDTEEKKANATAAEDLIIFNYEGPVPVDYENEEDQNKDSFFRMDEDLAEWTPNIGDIKYPPLKPSTTPNLHDEELGCECEEKKLYVIEGPMLYGLIGLFGFLAGYFVVDIFDKMYKKGCGKSYSVEHIGGDVTSALPK